VKWRVPRRVNRGEARIKIEWIPKNSKIRMREINSILNRFILKNRYGFFKRFIRLDYSRSLFSQNFGKNP